MEKSEVKIAIVGAGVSGLICALALENHGFSPTIFEKSDRVGGRVKTDVYEGYQLDRGFQVLLTAYPMAKKYLSSVELNLQLLEDGAMLFHDGMSKFGDPLSNIKFLFPTLFSSKLTLLDKWKIFNLKLKVQKKSLEEIFNSEETTTLHYLQRYGFSNQIIENFFRPFFSGIFLEEELTTSSRMFEFVYKMFAEGKAAIPKAGMEAIPIHLKSKLKKTTFHFNTQIDRVSEGSVLIDGLAPIQSDYIVITHNAEGLVGNLQNQQISWNSCDCLYFEVNTRVIKSPTIGLLTKKGHLVNNIFYPSSINSTSKGAKELLSVTIVKSHNLTKLELIKKVEEELNTLFGIKVERFLKHYYISQALPILRGLQYDLPSTETKLLDRVFLSGDSLLNGSLNAAMISGERAAQAIINAVRGVKD